MWWCPPFEKFLNELCHFQKHCIHVQVYTAYSSEVVWYFWSRHFLFLSEGGKQAATAANYSDYTLESLWLCCWISIKFRFETQTLQWPRFTSFQLMAVFWWSASSVWKDVLILLASPLNSGPAPFGGHGPSVRTNLVCLWTTQLEILRSDLFTTGYWLVWQFYESHVARSVEKTSLPVCLFKLNIYCPRQQS